MNYYYLPLRPCYPLFEKIVLGVCKNQKNIKLFIEENLSENWFYDRVDPTMRSIISLGVYELSYCKNTPHNVIIDEYVSIAGLFFNKTNTEQNKYTVFCVVQLQAYFPCLLFAAQSSGHKFTR